MNYKFFDQRTGSGTSVNEEIAQKLNKSVIGNLKEGKFILGLKIIFGW